MTNADYLKVGMASDLKDPKNRVVFRFLEILPGLLSWGTLTALFLLSWLKPFFVAVFIIAFTIYWFFRTVYFSFHLRSSYQRMKVNEKTDWLEKLNNLNIDGSSLPINSWKDIYHLVFLPICKEPLEIAREAFSALIKTDYPKDKMIVVLAAEESNRANLELIVSKIQQEFGGSFFKLLATWHPAGLPGEIPGHGSNDAWAAKEVRKMAIDPLQIPYENIIVSSFDIDTCVFPKYFSCLTHYYLTTENQIRVSFQPIPLYINNIWQAPFFSRIFSFTSTFWQMMCQERPEKLLTFSSHSMPFRALVDAGFKQVNAVSDDSRIFWQCFLNYNGDYKVIPIFYPVSMDANVSKSFWRTIKNIYKQQRRWAYGAADIAFVFFGFLNNKKISRLKKFLKVIDLLEGHWSWATASIMIFFLGWLPIVIGVPEFSQALIAYSLPKTISRILTFSMVGLILSAYFAILLLPPKPSGYGRFKYLFLAVEWLLLPLIMIFFSSLPALEAQTRLMMGKYLGFWPTEKTR